MALSKLVATLAATVAVAVCLHAAPKSDHVSQLLADARQALGGEQRLSAITSFTAKGTIWVTSGRARYPGVFTLACELPDTFIRTDDRERVRAFETTNFSPGAAGEHGEVMSPPEAYPDVPVLRVGFAGGDVIQDGYRGPIYSHYFPPQPPDRTGPERFLARARLDFVQVTLALFAASFPSVPLQFRDAPSGDGIEVTMAGEAPLLLRFDPNTHLPAAFGAMAYSNFHDVNGMKVPFRFVTKATVPAVGPYGIGSGVARLGEQGWEIKEIRFNVKIDPKVFKTK